MSGLFLCFIISSAYKCDSGCCSCWLLIVLRYASREVSTVLLGQLHCIAVSPIAVSLLGRASLWSVVLVLQ